MRLTEEQQAAVDAPVCNLLVTAAAGAGKTQVLSKRIIRRILDAEHPAEVDRLLVVTFTRAAAAEMRERIYREIEAAAEQDPTNQRLARQLTLVQNASILTVDGFCTKVVREHFYDLGIKADFRIADSAESELVKMQALDEVMEELYREQNPDFMELVENYGNAKNDSAVCDMILKLYRHTENLPFPEEWLTEKEKMYDFEESASWFTALKNQGIDCLRMAIRKAREGAKRMTNEAYRKSFREDAKRLTEAMERAMEGEGGLEVKFPNKPTQPKAPVAERKLFDDYRDSIKVWTKKASNMFSIDEADAKEKLSELLPIVRGLIGAVRRLNEVYTEKKNEKNMLTFGDLERYALAILTTRNQDGAVVPSEAAEEFRVKFDEIYIDEYQDCNDIQEWIFRMISGEFQGQPNIFMVGDMKQSIYRFRHTNPMLFLEKKERYSEDADAKERKIELTKNFRCRSQIIDAVNMVFSAVMSEQAGEVDYQDGERLVHGATYYETEPPYVKQSEFLIVDTDQTEVEDDEAPDESRAEANLVAQRILELLSDPENTVYDKERGITRPMTYRDIVILLRAPKGRAQVYVDALTSAGIPAYCNLGSGYFDAVEIRTFLSLLQIVDNPRQDIPLIAVLRSPIVGFSEDELAQIRLTDKKAEYYDCVSLMAETETNLGARCRSFLERLKKWRRAAKSRSVDTLILELLEETEYDAYVGAMQGGALRRANLQALYERAKSYGDTSYRGLFHFIRYLEETRESGQDLDGAQEIAEHMDAVRIMSMHKSKGLEFPVVFLSECGKQFNYQDCYGKLLIHNDWGIGLKRVNAKRHTTERNLLYDAISNRIQQEILSEELRLFYVGMTRAREKLIVTGRMANYREKAEAWKEEQPPILPAIVQESKTLIELLARCVAMDQTHQFAVRVMPVMAIGDEAGEPEKKELPSPLPCDREIAERLSFCYPDRKLSLLPPLLSVSELKRMGQESEGRELIDAPIDLPKPRFLTEKRGLSPAERGTVNHFVMQHLDIHACQNEEDVRSTVSNLVARELLTEEEARNVDIDGITAFLSSRLAERMRRAEELHKEDAFMMRLPVSELPPELWQGNTPGESDDFVVVQGIIDCWFTEGDTIVVVDYKTDRTDSEEIIRSRYQTQLDFYANALKKKYFKKNSEKLIYLFYNRSIIEMD